MVAEYQELLDMVDDDPDAVLANPSVPKVWVSPINIVGVRQARQKIYGEIRGDCLALVDVDGWDELLVDLRQYTDLINTDRQLYLITGVEKFHVISDERLSGKACLVGTPTQVIDVPDQGIRDPFKRKLQL